MQTAGLVRWGTMDDKQFVDTIDHDILIKRLSIWYDIYSTALSWLSSYLADIYQIVKIGNCFSAALPTSCDFPQGSVLRPLLFMLLH